MRKTLTLTAAVLLAIGLVTTGTVLAQIAINATLMADVTRLAQGDSGQDDSLNIVIGAAGDVVQACGGSSGGTEHIYDANADGIPDFAQMALIAALEADGNTDVQTAVDAIRTEVANQVQYGTHTPDADATEQALMTDAIALWLGIDIEPMGDYADCFPAAGNNIGAAAVNIGAGNDASAWVGADVDLDGDGRTNLEEWEWVSQDAIVGPGKVLASSNDTAAQEFQTEIELWLDVVQDATQNQDTFPEAGANVPVGTAAGLGLLALGIASGGAYIIRRKK